MEVEQDVPIVRKEWKWVEEPIALGATPQATLVSKNISFNFNPGLYSVGASTPAFVLDTPQNNSYNQTQEGKSTMQTLREGPVGQAGEIGIGFVPYTGEISDFAGCVRGEETVTGKKMAGLEQAASCVALPLPLVGGGLVRKGTGVIADVFKWIGKKAGDLIGVTKNADDAAKAAGKAARSQMDDVTKTGAEQMLQQSTGNYPLLIDKDLSGKVFNLQKTPDGKLRYFINGERRTPKPKLDFVLQDGKLKFGEGHSYIANGNNVEYAGQISIAKDGKSIELWNDHSGHYQPRPDDLIGQQKVVKAFKKQFGMDLPHFIPHK